MNSINPIELKMENIKTMFQYAKKIASECDDIDAIIKHLENTDPEFRSVGYEGVAMCLALKNFSPGESPRTNNNPLKLWNSLLSVSPNHSPQIHIGLGWAIAESKPIDLTFLDAVNSMMQFRVWDGCGYYDGIFRQRQTIKNQLRNDIVKEKNFKAYDEGIGRSLWYSCKGDPAKVSGMIQTFSSSRHADLWRGVGIACSYVGGSDDNILKNIFSLSGKHSIQLKTGAVMIAKSRS
ncbi:MAG: DUF1702 family protein, partial [Bacteroidota bacterium]